MTDINKLKKKLNELDLGNATLEKIDDLQSQINQIRSEGKPKKKSGKTVPDWDVQQNYKMGNYHSFVKQCKKGTGQFKMDGGRIYNDCVILWNELKKRKEDK
tara:strand:- start:1939 stop:2244 length:306 start_codon:yes stop_codon:yes gene_type:complete